jgi:hypothetical protein
MPLLQIEKSWVGFRKWTGSVLEDGKLRVLRKTPNLAPNCNYGQF